MEEEILADIPNEGEDFTFGPEETETPVTTPVTDKPVVDEPAEEGGNTPTEEEPDYKERTSKRVQQLLRERKEERARVEELERQVQEISQRNNPRQEEEIPDRFVRLFGDDPETWKEYQAMNQEDKATWKAEVIEELRESEAREANETEEYAQNYESLMDELEEDGKTFDRNALMKFITERPIFRQDGNPDFATALELMEAKKPKANVQARKQIASITPQKPGASKGYKTPDDLRGGWSSI